MVSLWENKIITVENNCFKSEKMQNNFFQIEKKNKDFTANTELFPKYENLHC